MRRQWMVRAGVWLAGFGIWMAERWWRTALVATALVAITARIAWDLVSAAVAMAPRVAAVAPATRVQLVVVVCLLAAGALLLKHLNRLLYGCVEIGCALAGAHYVLGRPELSAEALFAAATAAVYVIVRGAENCLHEAKRSRKLHRVLAEAARRKRDLEDAERYFAKSVERWDRDRLEAARLAAEFAETERYLRWVRAALEDFRAVPDREMNEMVQDAMRHLVFAEEQQEQLATRLAMLIGGLAGRRFRALEEKQIVREARDVVWLLSAALQSEEKESDEARAA